MNNVSLIIHEIIQKQRLLFCLVPENSEEKLKRQKIEAALSDPDTSLSKWQEFAKSEYGLVSGKYGRFNCLENNAITLRVFLFCFQMI